MKMTMVGLKPVQFTDDRGNEIRGQSAFLEYKDPQCLGIAMEKVFLRGDLMVEVIPNFPCEVEVEYFKNRIVNFTVIKK